MRYNFETVYYEKDHFNKPSFMSFVSFAKSEKDFKDKAGDY